MCAGSASGRSENAIQITSVVGKPGGFTATWTLPPGGTSSDIYWTTDPTLAQVGVGPHTAPGGKYGVPLRCIPFGNATSGVGFDNTCAGFSDLGDDQTSYTATDVKPGTYYVQVDGFGAAVGYSEVATVVVPAGKSGGTTTAGGLAQVIEGQAEIEQDGQDFECSAQTCPLHIALGVGDQVSTPPNTYLKVKTKSWGTVLIGPNTTFIISKYFAMIAGGEVEYYFGQRDNGPCTVYVGPAPALKFGGKAPPGEKASVDGASDPACQGLVFHERTYKGHIVVDDVHGHLTVATPGGDKAHIAPGQEVIVAGGKVGPPAKLTLKTCELKNVGFGAFCPRG